MHIGSQLTSVSPFEQAVRKVLPLVRRLQAKYALEFFSIGGGLGIVYQPALASGEADWWKSSAAKNILTPEKYAARLLPLLKPLGLKILIEPGRFISGNAGILVTRVEYVKRTGKKNFVIVDAAMNDLIRPAFYDAYHEIVPLTRAGGATMTADVVGGDLRIGRLFLQGPSAAESRRRRLPRGVERGRLRLCDGVELQFASAGGRSVGEWQTRRRCARTPAGQGNLVGRKNRAVAGVRQ